jgi:hypothetical protein
MATLSIGHLIFFLPSLNRILQSAKCLVRAGKVLYVSNSRSELPRHSEFSRRKRTIGR